MMVNAVTPHLPDRAVVKNVPDHWSKTEIDMLWINQREDGDDQDGDGGDKGRQDGSSHRLVHLGLETEHLQGRNELVIADL